MCRLTTKIWRFPFQHLLKFLIFFEVTDESYIIDKCAYIWCCFFQYDLSKHFSTHTDEKLVSCPVCSKGFARDDLLKRHVEKVHKDVQKYECEECGKTFLTLSYLNDHMEKHKKKKPFTCNVCSKSFVFRQVSATLIKVLLLSFLFWFNNLLQLQTYYRNICQNHSLQSPSTLYMTDTNFSTKKSAKLFIELFFINCYETLPNSVFGFLTLFLSVIVNGHSTSFFTIVAGVLQGSLLRSLIFLKTKDIFSSAYNSVHSHM